MDARMVTENEVLGGHVNLGIECLDRVYLNAYVTILQSSDPFDFQRGFAACGASPARSRPSARQRFSAVLWSALFVSGSCRPYRG
jgi:hypothetical protein